MPEKLVLTLDASQISLFYECQEKWHLQYLKQLQPKERNKLSLDKGTYIHWLLEAHYSKPRSTKECIKIARALAINSDDINLTEETLDFLDSRFMDYRLLYSEDDYQPVVIDGVPQIEVGFSIPLVDNNEYLFTLEGKIDMIAQLRQNGTTINFFVDHKTQSIKTNLYTRRIQFKTYALATQLNRGMVNYIGLQQELKKDYLRRELFSISDAELVRWRSELIGVFYKAVDCIYNSKFEQNWYSCDGKYRVCEYHELCEQTQPEIAELIQLSKFEKSEPWRPW